MNTSPEIDEGSELGKDGGLRCLVLTGCAETFFKNMIRPEFNVEEPPRAIEALRYEELVAMIDLMSDPDADEEVSGYYGELIECSLPGAEVADLLLWPGEWFCDKKMDEVDLSSEEIANYLLAWTGVRVIGAEGVVLPEIPESKRNAVVRSRKR